MQKMLFNVPKKPVAEPKKQQKAPAKPATKKVDNTAIKYDPIYCKIQQRRLQVLVHSCIYYEMDTNLVSDDQWNKWAAELVQLQNQNPDMAEIVPWADVFRDFDGSTGYNLPTRDDWVVSKAQQLIKYDKERRGK